MEFRILGPLEVDGPEGRLDLGVSQVRALLASLLLKAPETASFDYLIDALWDDRPPASARHLIHVYMSQLRGLLLNTSFIETRASGYAIDLTGQFLDATAFEDELDTARQAQRENRSADALTTYDAALARWRGPVVSGTKLGGEALIRAKHLEDIHTTAIEERIAPALALGRHAELIPELERLVASEPLREGLRRELIVALYRSGRQADALAAYQDARAQLSELGLEPGAELRKLERMVLQQDPSLLLWQASEPERASTPPRQRRVGVAAAVALASIAIVLAVVLVDHETSNHPGGSGATIPHDSIGELDAASGAVLSSVRIGAVPGPVSVAAGRVWVGEGVDRTLVAISAATGRIVRRIGLGTVPYGIQATPAAVWVANSFNGTLTQVIPHTGLVSTPRRPEPHSEGRIALTFGNGSLWSASQDGSLARLDPISGRLQDRFGHVFGPQAIAVGYGSIWIAQFAIAKLARLPIAGGRSDQARVIPIGGRASSITTGAGAVWAVTPENGSLWRINPRNNSVTTKIDVGFEPALVVVAGGFVWVASATDGVISRVDPRTDRVVQRIHVAGPTGGMAASGSRVWVSVR